MELFFLALLIFLMAFALGSGYPVAFALPGAAILAISAAALTGLIVTGSPDSYFHSSGAGQWLSAGVTNLRGVYWDVDRDTLIAIPLFIFMGLMLQRSKVAEDLLVTMAQLFGSIPGGLGISVVFVGALLAATTGIVGATVVAMGLISLPAMLQNNYSKPLATGTIAASGTLGQIIPPSIVLIILADQLASATDQANTARKAMHKSASGELTMPSMFDVASTSAGEMFLGAFLPGLVLVALYMVYILVYALIRPKVAPAVPYGGNFDSAFWKRVALILLPPLTLIFLVLGSIILGIATVNQAGAIGAAGALIMGGYRLKEGHKYCYVPSIIALVGLALAAFALANYPMNIKIIQAPQDINGITIGIIATILLLIALIWSGWRTYKIDNTLSSVMIETAKTTSLVFIILLGAAMLTAAFRAFGGEELVRDFLNSLPGGFWAKFIIVMAVIFVLGFFLDFIEIAVVVVPIVAPILLADPSANITAVWLGVMIGLNIQTSFLTPPFGFALFYLRGVAPAIVRTVQMYKGVIAFIGLQIVALFIVGMYPPLVNYLPNRIALLSDTSPPPRNPRLQYCVDAHLVTQFENNRASFNLAISNARQLNLEDLPQEWQEKMQASIVNAENSVELLFQANKAAQTVDNSSSDYRPLHRFVRRLQSEINSIDEEIKKLIDRSQRFDVSEEQKQEWQQQQQELLADREKVIARIPDNWQEIQTIFRAIINEETKLRQQFNRMANESYKVVIDLQTILTQQEEFEFLKIEIANFLYSLLLVNNQQETAEAIKTLKKRLGRISEVDDMKKTLSDLQKELKVQPLNTQIVLALFNTLSQQYSGHRQWREKARQNLLPSLNVYESQIRHTIGLRNQAKFKREQALEIAKCLSNHRDISLNF